MTIDYKGHVFWANGDPISDVEVRIFEPGDNQKQLGEELTVQPGFSKSDGSFSVQAQDSELLDNSILAELEERVPFFNGVDDSGSSLGSDRRPIFQFTYPLNGRNLQSTTVLRKLHRGYRLLNNPPVDFKPSSDGFIFKNEFKAFKTPITLPAWLGAKQIPGIYGLCGGMSSAAYDYRLARISNSNAPNIRSYTSVPNNWTKLHRYLIRRSLDTFGVFGVMLDKVGDWTLLPNQGQAGTQRLTLDELPNIKQRLQNLQCVVLTLIYEHASNRSELISKIWNNHQVLAYNFIEIDKDEFNISIYDSNFPDEDDAVLEVKRIQVGSASGNPVFGLTSSQIVPGRPIKEVRGFFPMHYQAVSPP